MEKHYWAKKAIKEAVKSDWFQKIVKQNAKRKAQKLKDKNGKTK